MVVKVKPGNVTGGLGAKLNKLLGTVKDNFLVGFMLFGPIFGTLYFIIIIFRFLDGILSGIYDRVIGFHIPGLGLISLLVLIVATGAIGRTYLATIFVRSFEALVSKIPIAKSVYAALKNITEMFQKSEGKFGKPTAMRISNSYIPGIELSSHGDFSVVLIPSTPNPTTGFVFIVPKKDITPLGISIDDFMKFVVSMGLYATPVVGSIKEASEGHAKT